MSEPARKSSHPKDFEELRRNEERFRLLIESIQDYAIFILEPDGTVASWNPGAERFKGYKAHEIIGKHFSTFYQKADIDAGKPELELRVAAAEGRFEDEGWRVRKDGSLFWANVVITALRSKQDELLGFAKVTRDLTERREREQRLIRAQEELQRALGDLSRSNAELEEYAAFVSHDLQEPLRKMASFSGLLALRYKDKIDDEGKKYISYIIDGASRMRSLITDVLDYARIGRSRPEIQLLSLDAILEGAQKDLEVSLNEAKGRISSAPLPKIRGSAVLLSRVFLNILNNAIKYRDPSRPLKIDVAAELKGAEWIVSFQDNGIGFDPAHADEILRPFRRLHSKEKYPGTGLGLAGAKKIMEGHGGRIWAEGRPGAGARFLLAFPASEPDAKA